MTTEDSPHQSLKARRLGLHTQHEAIVLMRVDCPVCRSEGLSARSEVVLKSRHGATFATLYQVSDSFVRNDEVGLSEAAWMLLKVGDGEPVTVEHAPRLESLGAIRSRMFGHRLGEAALRTIIADVVAGRYSDIHLASFISNTATLPLSDEETTALTRVMVETGDQLEWRTRLIADKHSVGGLPGNRTTPIVVAIVAANGITIPKTSSRAITSPAGTADAMEALAPVNLDLQAIRRVVEREGGCVVWGGSVHLSPADDVLIRVERALDVDSEGQLIASVLSKKIAAGSSHLVVDMPVGPTAKVRSADAANALAARLEAIGAAFGMIVRVVFGDGLQPIGRGLGPALEARDVLAVLTREKEAPPDLRKRAAALAGALLELVGKAPPGHGQGVAEATIDDGRAWHKFQRICEAQGGMRTPARAEFQTPLLSDRAGVVASVDNRKLSTLAKLSGAPENKAAGLEMHVKLGDQIGVGEPLCTIHAEAKGEMRYALDYAAANPAIFGITD